MDRSICFVIPRFLTAGIGGAELQVYLLSEELCKRGWKVEIMSRDTKANDKLTKSIYFNPQIKYHYYTESVVRSFEFFKVFIRLFRTNSAYYYQRTDSSLTGSVALWPSRPRLGKTRHRRGRQCLHRPPALAVLPQHGA